jgi:hypothetical protein
MSEERVNQLGDQLKAKGIDPEMVKEEVQNILTEMAEENPEGVVMDVASPSSFAVLRSKKGKDRAVEVAPGIMVSQKLIDEAVRMTTFGGDIADPAADYRERLAEERRLQIAKDQAELRQDIDNSRTLVLEMLNRMREPAKYDEKFVSYDTMPGPLQRVVKAYIEAEEANKNLSEAVAALAGDLKPPVAKPE